MSDDNVENLNNQKQKGGKVTPASAFQQIKEGKIKAKGEELKKAVTEAVAADEARTAAFEKVTKLNDQIKDLEAQKAPF